MTDKINIIVATSNNLVIGKDNDLPWKLPTDLKYFKEITNNSTVIMGRKCWDSIPSKFRPLPNRRNVIVTNNENYLVDGAVTINNFIDTLEFIKKEKNDERVFIIGGGEIYKQSFKFADRVYLTRILADVEGDVFLEGFDVNEWNLLSSSDEMEENSYKFKFEIYNKK